MDAEFGDYFKFDRLLFDLHGSKLISHINSNPNGKVISIKNNLN